MTRTTTGVIAALTLLLGVTAFTPWLIGEARGTSASSEVPNVYPLTFPDDFAWGVAVAAQHVEHQQPSDWTAFERRVIAEGNTGTGDRPGQAKPGHIRDLDLVSEEVRRKKVDFDGRFEDDFAALSQLGLNSYRFSISWARLFPSADMTEPDAAGVAFYSKVI
jgi:beta-glucosidase/6-phospho-beta-glucosidase/beta-galactosidase